VGEGRTREKVEIERIIEWERAQEIRGWNFWPDTNRIKRRLFRRFDTMNPTLSL